ncbi:hypothetical protein FACS1894217_04840 [Clostridia bacterium]|nr:hypothetical protein FACS1894217_04840 [Clostridia bacterium]
MTFKEQVARDNAEVFQNNAEFAELMTIKYSGATFEEIPVILDHDIIKDRAKPANDHASGIELYDVRAYINEANLPGVFLRKGKTIEIGANKYRIVRVAFEMGEYILDCELLDE